MIDYKSAIEAALMSRDYATLLPIFGVFIVFLLIFTGVTWIYTSLAFYAIGKKKKIKTPEVAWIPLIGPALISSKVAKMHWWPILLIIGFFIPFVNILSILAFLVFSYIWMWKTFKAVGRPGWWSLTGILCLIPFVGILFIIVYFILLGIAAWGN